MNEAQTAAILKAAQLLTVALGADLKPTGTQSEQHLEGLAFVLGRLVKKPDFALAVARLAAKYTETEKGTA
jgi:hypothetical protein